MQRTLTALTLLAFLNACGPGWHRVDPTPTADPRTQYLVYHHGASDRWHAFRSGQDSVSGIPWLASMNCDSCRVALPRSAVDSIEEGHPTSGFWKGVGVTMGSLMVFCAVACPKGD